MMKGGNGGIISKPVFLGRYPREYDQEVIIPLEETKKGIEFLDNIDIKESLKELLKLKRGK